jgi:hypothetical protein
MTDLTEILQQLRLSEYLDGFIYAGFSTWELLVDITEDDL